MPSGPGAERPWQASVEVVEDVPLAAELYRRWELVRDPHAASVTDLLALRRAYWRLTVGPVGLAPEREARVEAGRRVHRALETIFASEGAVEVRVRREGIVGRVDALTDRPVEFKTTALAPPAEVIVDQRPEHVEQLAMYCALTDVRAGRLVRIVPGAAEVPEVRTVDLEFTDLAKISGEMRRRADALRVAVDSRRPEPLPRCPWYDHGCEFRESSTCDCTGAEDPERDALRREVRVATDRADLDAVLAPRLSQRLGSVRPTSIGRFRDLIYPRRTFFERTDAGSEFMAPLPGPQPVHFSPSYERLASALESGPIGEVAGLPIRADEPEEEVAAFRGTPYLARTSRSGAIPRAEEIVGKNPQYALDLGFRCAATGTDTGRVIVAYERAADPANRLRVFELRFRPVTTFSRLWRARASALDRAVAEGSPTDLPACPSWMFEECPYRVDCGCAAPAARSQR